MTNREWREKLGREGYGYYYDEEEIIPNCTVQILKNTKTGDESIGWWRGGIEDMPTWFETQKSEEDDND